VGFFCTFCSYRNRRASERFHPCRNRGWQSGCSGNAYSRTWRLEEEHMRLIGDFIFLVLFVIFLAGWLIAWAAFHIAGGGIHLLLVLAVIWLVIHLFRRSRTV
jgi:Family of unknown function (DUF5670)